MIPQNVTNQNRNVNTSFDKNSSANVRKINKWKKINLIQRSVAWSQLTGDEQKLMNYLYHRADDRLVTIQYRIPQSDLITYLGCYDNKKINKLTKSLEDKGFLEVVSGTGRECSRYYFLENFDHAQYESPQQKKSAQKKRERAQEEFEFAAKRSQRNQEIQNDQNQAKENKTTLGSSSHTHPTNIESRDKNLLQQHSILELSAKVNTSDEDVENVDVVVIDKQKEAGGEENQPTEEQIEFLANQNLFNQDKARIISLIQAYKINYLNMRIIIKAYEMAKLRGNQILNPAAWLVAAIKGKYKLEEAAKLIEFDLKQNLRREEFEKGKQLVNLAEANHQKKVDAYLRYKEKVIAHVRETDATAFQTIEKTAKENTKARYANFNQLKKEYVEAEIKLEVYKLCCQATNIKIKEYPKRYGNA